MLPPYVVASCIPQPGDYTALMWAAHQGHAAVCTLLVDNGADVKLVDEVFECVILCIVIVGRWV